MEKLTSQLFIGDEEDARRIDPNKNRFDMIVTVGFNKLKYNGNPPEASDTGVRFYFPDGNHDYNDFKTATNYVITQIENDEIVFVHCQAGISRSARVCAAVLAETSERTLTEALKTIENKRPVVNPANEIRESMQRYTNKTILPDYSTPAKTTTTTDDNE
jgi:hypothetical protein